MTLFGSSEVEVAMLALTRYRRQLEQHIEYADRLAGRDTAILHNNKDREMAQANKRLAEALIPVVDSVIDKIRSNGS